MNSSQPLTPEDEDLRDLCQDIQILTGLDDVAWENRFKNDEGLYGLVKQRDQQDVKPADIYKPTGREYQYEAAIRAVANIDGKLGVDYSSVDVAIEAIKMYEQLKAGDK